LTGSYREEHLFELKLAYEAWQFTLGQVEKVDGQIARQLGRMKCDRALPPLEPKARPKRRVNSPGFDVRAALYYVVGLDLTEIEGISELTALRAVPLTERTRTGPSPPVPGAVVTALHAENSDVSLSGSVAVPVTYAACARYRKCRTEPHFPMFARNHFAEISCGQD
jgi:hypothetical protein